MSDCILKYLPEFYKEILDFVELDKTSCIELEDLKNAIKKFLDNNFVLTSDIKAIQRREKILNIQADPSIETLDFRKKRILNRYRTKPPFTEEYLQQQLDFLVGQGKAYTSIDEQNFILSICTDIKDTPLFKEMENLVHTIKPANMIYQQSTLISNDLELEEHIQTHNIKWNYVFERDLNYKLDGTWGIGEKPFETINQGNWILGEKPFATLENEVIIK